MAGQWDLLAEELGGVVAALPWGSFVIIEYGRGEADDGPYAQAAPGPAGWYAEVVSNAYVPAADYPVDEGWLQEAGWLRPDGETLNWWRTRLCPAAVAPALIDGLRHGRECTDPSAFTFRTGRFPDGPRGGEPAPVPVGLELLTA